MSISFLTTAQAIRTDKTAARTLEEYLTFVPSSSFLMPSTVRFVMTDTIFTMKIGVEIVVLMYLGFLISTVGYDKVIQMLKQIQSVKEETKNE